MAYLFALIAIALWGSLAALATRLSAVPPLALASLALTIGGLAGLPWCRSWRVPWRTAVVGIVGIFAYHALLFTAFDHAPAIEANLVNYLWPLLIVVLAPWILGGGLHPRQVLGALLGFAGAALAILGGADASWSMDHLVGFACAALAAVVWAVYSLMTKRLPSFPSTAVSGFCLVAGLLGLGWSRAQAPWSWMATLAGSDWLLVLALGLGPMGIAFIAWDVALKRGDPRAIGALSYLTPLWSTAALAFVGHRHLGASAALALALIVAGAVLGSLTPRTARPPG